MNCLLKPWRIEMRWFTPQLILNVSAAKSSTLNASARLLNNSSFRISAVNKLFTAFRSVLRRWLNAVLTNTLKARSLFTDDWFIFRNVVTHYNNYYQFESCKLQNFTGLTSRVVGNCCPKKGMSRLYPCPYPTLCLSKM